MQAMRPSVSLKKVPFPGDPKFPRIRLRFPPSWALQFSSYVSKRLGVKCRFSFWGNYAALRKGNNLLTRTQTHTSSSFFFKKTDKWVSRVLLHACFAVLNIITGCVLHGRGRGRSDEQSDWLCAVKTTTWAEKRQFFKVFILRKKVKWSWMLRPPSCAWRWPPSLPCGSTSCGYCGRSVSHDFVLVLHLLTALWRSHSNKEEQNNPYLPGNVVKIGQIIPSQPADWNVTKVYDPLASFHPNSWPHVKVLYQEL